MRKVYDALAEFGCAMRAPTYARGKELSAAVFHYLSGQLHDVGQDWAGWLQDGRLDAVMPINYSMSTCIFDELN